MLVLDTNVVAELMKPVPNAVVLQWFEVRPLEQMNVTAITVAEILCGIDRLPEGRRKSDLSARFRGFLTRGFDHRVWSFDVRAAQAFALLKGSRERAGRPIDPYDAMIAAIARSQGAAVVTRNVADFAACGVAVVDPWSGREEA